MGWRRDRLPTPVFLGFPGGSAGRESACNVGDLGSIPGLGKSPGEGKGYSLQYSGLENSMDYIVHGHHWVTFTFNFFQFLMTAMSSYATRIFFLYSYLLIQKGYGSWILEELSLLLSSFLTQRHLWHHLLHASLRATSPTFSNVSTDTLVFFSTFREGLGWR